VTSISPKAVLVGVLGGTVAPIVYGLATKPLNELWGGSFWQFVLWLPVMLLVLLATGGVAGALAAVFFCALRKPRRI